jgi:hypothetical protein
MKYESMLDDLARWQELFGGDIPSKAEIEAVMRGEIDADSRRRMLSYTHSLDRRTVTVTAACIDPPETWSVDDFQKAIAEFVERVPSERRADAKVVFRGGYEETCDLTITYERPQTDEEWGLALAHALMHVSEINNRDRAAYERVKKKLAR